MQVEDDVQQRWDKPDILTENGERKCLWDEKSGVNGEEEIGQKVEDDVKFHPGVVGVQKRVVT